MAVAFLASGNNSGQDVSVLSITGLNVTGVERAVIVTIGTRANATVSSVTVGGQTATQIGNIQRANAETWMFMIVNPPSNATTTITVTFSGPVNEIAIGASSYTGVEQTSVAAAHGVVHTQSGNIISVSQTITETELGIAVDSYTHFKEADTPGAGQTEMYTVVPKDIEHSSSREAKTTSGNVTMSYSLTRATSSTYITTLIKEVQGLSLVRFANETENLTEANLAITGPVVNINETLNIPEQINASKGVLQIINETENLSENTVNPRGLARIINEVEEVQAGSAGPIPHAIARDNTPAISLITTFTQGVTLASTNFVAGRKYLIMANADIRMNNLHNAEVKLTHQLTDFADSLQSVEAVNTATTWYKWAYFTVWTAVSGEDLNIFYRTDNGAGTMEIDNQSIFAMEISELLTEGTDWHYNENTTVSANAVTEKTGASLTFTPPVAGDDWLVMSRGTFDGYASTVPVQTTRQKGTGLSTLVQIRNIEDATEAFAYDFMRVYNLPASSHTFDYAFLADVVEGQHRDSKIFAINLSKFAVHEHNSTDVNSSILEPLNFGDQLGTLSITPDEVDDFWFGSWTSISNTLSGSLDDSFEYRHQIDNVDNPLTQTADAHPFFPRTVSAAGDAHGGAMYGLAESQSVSAHTFDVDASGPSAITYRRDQFSMFAVQMKVAGGNEAIAVRDLVRLLNETINVIEAVESHPGLNKIVNEVLNITENNLRVLGLTQIVNESENIPEQTNRLLGLIRLANETENLLENQLSILGLVRIANETENITELIDDVPGAVKVINETENITENVIQKLTAQVIIKVVNETVNITELVDPVPGAVKINNETLNIQEASLSHLDMVRILNETESINENIVKLLGLIRVVDEVEDIQEQIATLRGRIQTVNEIEDITEGTLNLRGSTRIVNETVNVLENIISLRGRIQQISETVDIPENIARLLAINRSINETENIPENINRRQSQVRILNEIVDILEDNPSIIGLNKIVNETENITENSINVLGLVRVVNETINVLEDIVSLKGIIVSVDETQEISELIVRLRGASRIANETLNIPEQINRLGSQVRLINENENVQENLVDIRGRIQIINETVNILENALGVRGIVRLINENENVTEAIITAKGVLRIVNEILDIQEGVISKREIVNVVNESLNILENIVDSRTLVRITNETVDIIEQINNTLGIVRTVNETVEISELLLAVRGLTQIVNETENIEEQITNVVGLVRIILESLDIQEATATSIGKVIIVNELLEILENQVSVRGLVRSINETEEIIEQAERASGIVRVVNETETVVENITKFQFFIKFIISFGTQIVRGVGFHQKVGTNGFLSRIRKTLDFKSRRRTDA